MRLTEKSNQKMNQSSIFQLVFTILQRYVFDDVESYLHAIKRIA